MKRFALILSTLLSITLAISPTWSADTASPKQKKPALTKPAKKSKPRAVKAPAATPAPQPPAPVQAPTTPVAPTTEPLATVLGTTTTVQVPKTTPDETVSVPTAAIPAAPAKPATAPVETTMPVTAMAAAPQSVNPSIPVTRVIVIAPIAPPAALAPSLGNPYLQPAFVAPLLANQPPADFFPAFANPQGIAWVTALPFTSNGIGSGPTAPMSALQSLLPAMPPLDQAILPTIKKVQPTGEKPLYVLTFKCPTELIGIASPPIKVLHWVVTIGMDGINSTNLLPFNMQQVCQ